MRQEKKNPESLCPVIFLSSLLAAQASFQASQRASASARATFLRLRSAFDSGKRLFCFPDTPGEDRCCYAGAVTRTGLSPESYVFCAHDDPNKPVNTKDMSRTFKIAARKLEQTGAMKLEVRKGKPS